jgi:hypothetical protein
MRISTVVREPLSRTRVALGFGPRPPRSLTSRAVRERLRVADATDGVVAAVLYRDVIRLTADGTEDEETLRATDEATYFDSLAPTELARILDQLRLRARAGARALEPAAWWRDWRALRSVAVVVVVVAVCLGLASFRPFAARDRALGKKVTASGVLAGHDLGKLVDGERGEYDTVDAVTSTGSDPWMMVDLGSVVRIRRIVVCNRGDRDMDAGLPYALDVSEDGSSFREITKRTQHFGDGTWLSPPWTVKLDTRARYVRVRAHDYVALSELEVY